MLDTVGAAVPGNSFVYRIVRYTPNLVRGEWVNVGVLVFHPQSGERRLRLIEDREEYNRVRRLHPHADEALLRAVKDDLQSRFETADQVIRETRGEISIQDVVANWDRTLSNALQLAPPTGVLAQNLDEELERLYADHVALQRRGSRIGLPGSRSSIRSYCSQVFRQARLWARLEKSVRIADYTFPGDPLRLDFGYRRNGTRGFVHALSATRSPGDAKLLAYTAKRIQEKAGFASEFAAVTDVALNKGNERHRFVSDTLRDAGIEPVALEAFATWVPKLSSLLQ
jgi:Protein of unknown function (DUF3037)